MAVTVTEANAIAVVLRRLHARSYGDYNHEPVDDGGLVVALARLTAAAEKRLEMKLVRPDGLDPVLGYLRATDSDGAAQAVCRALAEHESHGGSIPWPSIRGPLDEWKAAHP